jgi:hypothetical protein
MLTTALVYDIPFSKSPRFQTFDEVYKPLNTIATDFYS